MEKKIVIAKIQVEKGKEKDFLTLISPLIEATKKESGTLLYTLYQATQNPAEFIIYEEYVDQAAFEAHGKTEHFQFFIQEVSALLAKEIDIQIF